MKVSQQKTPSSHFSVVALASSAGGLTALAHILSHLPAHFPAAIVLVQHLSPRHPSLLAEILARKTSLHVKEAEDGDPLCLGTAYVAPPDRHLLLASDGKLRLSQEAQVQHVRPSADLLFASVAVHYKERVLAVVLTGTGRDGVEGVRAIKQMGGTVIAQDEATAEFFGMPGAAIASGNVDWVLPLEEIPQALVSLVMGGESS